MAELGEPGPSIAHFWQNPECLLVGAIGESADKKAGPRWAAEGLAKEHAGFCPRAAVGGGDSDHIGRERLELLGGFQGSFVDEEHRRAHGM